MVSDDSTCSLRAAIDTCSCTTNHIPWFVDLAWTESGRTHCSLYSLFWQRACVDWRWYLIQTNACSFHRTGCITVNVLETRTWHLYCQPLKAQLMAP